MRLFIDLGRTMWYVLSDYAYNYHSSWVIKDCTPKKLYEQFHEDWLFSHTPFQWVYTFTPNVFWKFAYKILQSQFWLLWVIQAVVEIDVDHKISELHVNKVILWKWRPKKDEIIDLINNVSEDWVVIDNHDEADAYKLFLYVKWIHTWKINDD